MGALAASLSNDEGFGPDWAQDKGVFFEGGVHLRVWRRPATSVGLWNIFGAIFELSLQSQTQIFPLLWSSA